MDYSAGLRLMRL